MNAFLRTLVSHVNDVSLGDFSLLLEDMVFRRYRNSINSQIDISNQKHRLLWRFWNTRNQMMDVEEAIRSHLKGRDDRAAFRLLSIDGRWELEGK
jgi:hypothetical protein